MSKHIHKESECNNHDSDVFKQESMLGSETQKQKGMKKKDKKKKNQRTAASTLSNMDNIERWKTLVVNRESSNNYDGWPEKRDFWTWDRLFTMNPGDTKTSGTCMEKSLLEEK